MNITPKEKAIQMISRDLLNCQEDLKRARRASKAGWISPVSFDDYKQKVKDVKAVLKWLHTTI